jgi:hypothetical protein
LRPGAFFLDFNSASPGAKIRAAGLVDGAGGRYVEGAVMTSGAALPHQVPLLLGGPDAAALLPRWPSWASPPRWRAKLGVASATKMCRSVMIKGLEAMVIESFTTARAYGVEDAVIASLHETFPGIDWEKQARVLLPARHRARPPPQRRGARGGQTVREAGLEPWSAPAAPPSARPGWPTSVTPALRRPAARPASRAAPTGAWRPTASSPQWQHKDTRMSFEKTPGWLDWYAGPSQAALPAAARRVDAHCHVFGPGAEFPFAPGAQVHALRRQQGQLFALRDHLGFARNVIVQATCHGADNRAMVDACLASGGKARGVATVRRSVSDPSCRPCTPPACAACASTSSSGWSTSRPRTS